MRTLRPDVVDAVWTAVAARPCALDRIIGLDLDDVALGRLIDWRDRWNRTERLSAQVLGR